jgi:hypothetical protein
LERGDARGVFVSLVRDPFSFVARNLAVEERIVEQLVGVGDDASPRGEVVVVDRGVGAPCGLSGGDQRRVSRF